MADLVLGVDGGNTKTIALVADRAGTILGAGRGGCADIYGAASADIAVRESVSVVEQALEEASASADDVCSSVFSMAGADWEEDYAFYRTELARELGLPSPPVVVNDAIGALRSGAPDGAGVSVVAGTYAAVGARGERGQTWHSSFWLWEAGATELGRQALRAVLRAALGIDPATSLTSRLLELYRERTPEALLHRLTRRTARPPRAELRRAARVVLEEAEGGDAAARRIVHEQGVLLGDYALAAAERVSLVGRSFPLVLAGGVLQQGTRLLPDTIIERVRASAPGAEPLRPDLPPAAGALLMALDAVERASDSVAGRIRDSLPSPVLFATD